MFYAGGGESVWVVSNQHGSFTNEENVANKIIISNL